MLTTAKETFFSKNIMIDEILNKKKEFSKEDILFLLKLTDKKEIGKLFNKALQIKKKFFEEKIYMQGVIQFSNYCEKDCSFCGISANSEVDRFRMNPEDILSSAKEIIKNGITSIVLQSGEDLYYDTDMISYLIYSIKQISNVSVTLNLGERDFKEYEAWKIVGADSYFMKFETSNKKLYQSFQKKSTFEKRLKHFEVLKEIGYKIGSGNLIGLPEQTLEDLADDLIFAKNLNPDFLTFTPFVPSLDFKNNAPKVDNYVLKSIAISRIIFPDKYIISSSAMDETKNLSREKGFKCGANAVMANFTPSNYREKYVVYPHSSKNNFDPPHLMAFLKKRIESDGLKIITK